MDSVPVSAAAVVSGSRRKPDAPPVLGWGSSPRFGYGVPSKTEDELRAEVARLTIEKTDLYAMVRTLTEVKEALEKANNDLETRLSKDFLTQRATELSAKLEERRELGINTAIRISSMTKQNEDLEAQRDFLTKREIALLAGLRETKKRARETEQILDKMQAVVAESQKIPRVDDHE